MYSGEATVSNDQLQGVLRAGELLRVRGLCHSGKPPPHQTSRHHSKQSSNNMVKLPDVGESSRSKQEDDRQPDMRIEDNMKIELLVKEEPIDWDEQQEEEVQSVTHSEHHSTASVKSVSMISRSGNDTNVTSLTFSIGNYE